jgi:hypothetical protein
VLEKGLRVDGWLRLKTLYKKTRVWLGTSDTLEEAARACDEAVCLLPNFNIKNKLFVSIYIPYS